MLRVLSLLLAASLLGTPDALAYACSITGEVQHACCCHHATADADPGATLRAQACCAVLPGPQHQAPAPALVTAPHLRTERPVALLAPAWAAPARPTARLLSVLPPWTGPPRQAGRLFLSRNRTLLI